MPVYDNSFFEFYKYLFIVALLLISGISVLVVMAMFKAKKDGEKQLNLIEKQVALLEEILAALKKPGEVLETGKEKTPEPGVTKESKTEETPE